MSISLRALTRNCSRKRKSRFETTSSSIVFFFFFLLPTSGGSAPLSPLAWRCPGQLSSLRRSVSPMSRRGNVDSRLVQSDVRGLARPLRGRLESIACTRLGSRRCHVKSTDGLEACSTRANTQTGCRWKLLGAAWRKSADRGRRRRGWS